MFSSKFFNLIPKSTNVGYYLGQSPLRWDTTTQRAIVSESSIQCSVQKGVNLIGIIQLCAYVSYLFIPLFKELSEKSFPNYNQIFWLCLFILTYAWGIIHARNIWTRSKELVSFFNEMIKIYKAPVQPIKNRKERAKGNWNRLKKNSIPDFAYFIVAFFNTMWILGCSIFTAMFLKNPERKQYPYIMIFPDAIKNKGVTFLLFLAFEIYSKMFMVYGMVVEAVILSVYIVLAIWGLKEIRSKKYPIQTMIDFYMKLNILSNVQAKCFFLSVPGLIGILGAQAVMGAVGCIRLHSIVSTFDLMATLNCGFNGLVVVFGLVHFIGKIPQNGHRVLTEMSTNHTHARNKYLKRKIGGLSLFGMKSGPIRIIKLSSVYNFFDGLTNALMTILAAFTEVHIAE